MKLFFTNYNLLYHTADTEFSVTIFFCLHFSEHAQWGLPVMSKYLWIFLAIYVDYSYFDA